MAKRLTREELEQDPLLDSYARVQNFYVEYKNVVIATAIAVVLIIGLSVGYYFYSSSQEDQARQLMGYAEQYYLNGNYENALYGSEEDFTVGFKQIINNYSGTDTGNLARYYAAVSEYNLGNTEQALAYMEEYEVPEGILGVGAISFKGVLLTELGRHSEAAEAYMEAANWDENTSTTPYNLLQAAYAYSDAGNEQQAIEQAEKIVSEYPDSPQTVDARRLAGRLQTASM